MEKVLKDIKERRDEILKFFIRFLIAFVLGFFIVFFAKEFLVKQGIISPDTLFKILPKIREYLEPILKFMKKSLVEKIIFIFLNNLRVVAIAGILSFITFGVFSEIVVYVNGIIVGIVVALFSYLPNVSGFKIFVTGILPHGVFEISALILSLSFAHRLSPTRKGVSEFIPYLRSYIIVIPLLLIAAIIEITITPRIMAIPGGIP